jgi:hypothetical protein
MRLMESAPQVLVPTEAAFVQYVPPGPCSRPLGHAIAAKRCSSLPPEWGGVRLGYSVQSLPD